MKWIDVLRIDNTSKSCRSILWVDGVLYGVVLEDPVRDHKIPKITAIPAGEYEVKFRDEPSEKRESYRAKYEWFHNHLWLQNVPGYQFVYIHVGNFPTDSDGCLLVNNELKADDDSRLYNSTNAFRKFYLKIKSYLDSGEQVKIRIRNGFESVGQKVKSE